MKTIADPRRPASLAARLASETLLASAASVLVLALVARAEGAGALQPLNATSHWLNGDRAADDEAPGWRTTGVGLATHLAATGFWAAVYELWLARRASPDAIVGKALAMAGIAVLADYRATPERFTPGWELVLTAKGMAAVYMAMAAGFALGGARRR